MVIISIGGTPGSGKTTLGRLLAEKLKLPFFGAGDLYREYGLARGLNINEMNKVTQEDPSVDHAVDATLSTLPTKHPSFVTVARLGYHFLPGSVKIYLTTDREVAAARIISLHRRSEQWKTVKEGVGAIKEREKLERSRWLKMYGTDITDLSHYDLVIDSTHTTPDQVLAKVMTYLKAKRQI